MKNQMTLTADTFPSTAGMTEALKLSAKAKGDNLATVMGLRRNSWATLQNRVARFAGGLVKLGLEANDRVAILALNSDFYTEALYATWWAGGSVVPVNTRWSVDEVAYSIADSEAKILLVDTAFSPMAEKLIQQIDGLDKLVLLAEIESEQGNYSIQDLINGSQPIEDYGRRGGDLAGIYYTGGTTGVSKGVMISHQAQCHTGLSLAIEMNFGEGAVYMHAAPMFHAADSAAGGAAMLAGAAHTYLPEFSPAGLQDLVAAEHVSHALLVPTMIGMLVNDRCFDRQKLKSLEFLLYGASAMPRGVLEVALEKLPHVAIAQGYGQTESVPIAILPPDYHCLQGPKSSKLKSAGRAAYGCEIRILHPDTRAELDVGVVGEVAVRSRNNMDGYWKLPDITAKTMQDGWVYTGDGGYLDEDGFVFLVDRLKDMIITGGENVYSIEVESVISTFPGVLASAVIGLPSETWGETVHAIVVHDPDVDISEAALIAHCRKTIAGYKVPRTVEFRTKALPISGAGKILKRELRQEHAL